MEGQEALNKADDGFAIQESPKKKYFFGTEREPVERHGDYSTIEIPVRFMRYIGRGEELTLFKRDARVEIPHQLLSKIKNPKIESEGGQKILVTKYIEVWPSCDTKGDRIIRPEPKIIGGRKKYVMSLDREMTEWAGLYRLAEIGGSGGSFDIWKPIDHRNCMTIVDLNSPYWTEDRKKQLYKELAERGL